MFSAQVICVLLALLFVDHTEACAASVPSPSSGSVDVVALTSKNFVMASSDTDMEEVSKKLMELATKKGITFFMAPTKTAENMGGMLAVHYKIPGAEDKCLQVLEFFQDAVKETTTTFVKSAAITCGSYEAINVK